MKITTKGRYAIRVLIDLAENADGQFKPLKDIAVRQGISQKYMESIMTLLSKNDCVEAMHGKGGGYRLNRAPSEYTVGSILKLSEGGLTAVSCTSQGASACSRAECCNALPMWEKLDKMINDFFEGITVADLLKDSDKVI